MGSTMSHVSERVGTWRQGSTNALAGSGIRSMSLSLIAWNPRIDDPSNPSPSSNTSSVRCFTGIEKCCQVPGRSQKRTSTTCTPASWARRITSVGDVPAAVRPVVDRVMGSIVAVMRGSPPGSRWKRKYEGPERMSVGPRKILSGCLRQACGKVWWSCCAVKQNLHQMHQIRLKWPLKLKNVDV